MALSNSVEESLKEASAHLRNALAYAARQERPVVCTRIAKTLSDIDSIGSIIIVQKKGEGNLITDQVPPAATI